MSASNLARIAGHLIAAKLEHERDGETYISDCPVCKGARTLVAGLSKYRQMEFRCATGCTEVAIMQALAATKDPDVPRFDAYKVEYTDEPGKTPKLVMPGLPTANDLAGQLAWLTSVFRLDVKHPATRVRRYGKRGQSGDIEISRAGARSLDFEPAAAIYSATRLIPMLDCLLISTDGVPYGFKNDHCKMIGRVVNMACEACESPDEAEEAAALVGMFTSIAMAVPGFTTYGSVTERFEALEVLRREVHGETEYERTVQRTYLIDSNTGEYVVRVSDMREAARLYGGGQLTHGWLDSHMARIGWTRAKVQGYAESGRAGRKGPHLRVDFYRGMMPDTDGNEGE